MSVSNTLIVLILSYFTIKLIKRVTDKKETMVVDVRDVDPYFIEDLLQQLQPPEPPPNPGPSNLGVELTLPGLSRSDKLYPSIMSIGQTRLANQIMEYVVDNFNSRINLSLPTHHTFIPSNLILFSSQESTTGVLYQLRFFVQDRTSSITLQLQSEVVKLPDSYYLNYVHVIGGDSQNYFGLEGAD